MRTALLCLAVLMGGCYHQAKVSQPTLTGSVTSESEGVYPFFNRSEYKVNTDGRENCRKIMLSAAEADRDQGLPAPTRFQVEMICSGDSGYGMGYGFYGAYSSALMYPIF